MRCQSTFTCSGTRGGGHPAIVSHPAVFFICLHKTDSYWKPYSLPVLLCKEACPAIRRLQHRDLFTEVTRQEFVFTKHSTVAGSRQAAGTFGESNSRLVTSVKKSQASLHCGMWKGQRISIFHRHITKHACGCSPSLLQVQFAL